MKTRSAAALGVLLLTVAAWAADNPLKTAKVGDWIEFVSRVEILGETRETKIKQTVVAKDADSVTLRRVTTVCSSCVFSRLSQDLDAAGEFDPITDFGRLEWIIRGPSCHCEQQYPEGRR